VVAAVCFHDGAGRVLTVRKTGTDRFMLPGGKLEAGESAELAAVREVREELGVDAGAVRLLGSFTAAAANEPGAVVESTVFTGTLTEVPRAAAEIAELRWVDPADPEVELAPLLRDHVLPALSVRVTVVGIGADGWPGLSARLQKIVLDADVVLGGARHLSLLPDVPGQRRDQWPSPLRDGLAEQLARHAGRSVVAIASGDPLVSGIGATLVEVLGPNAVSVQPALSSVTLARARMSWPAETMATVSVVGRDLHRVLRELAPGRRLVVLSSDDRTPAHLARLLTSVGYGGSRMTVLADLGSERESRVDGSARTWRAEVPPLNVVALELDGPVTGSWTSGLPDDAYEHDGQLTKRDLRASALARLAPMPGQQLWDVGAGAGSVGIEWLRAHPTCRAVAIERDPERAARIARNAARLGVPDLRVVTGAAPESLADLPRPDAVFVGGGATSPGLLDLCLAALAPGGRLVVHGVTLETEALLVRLHAERGGELTRISVEHVEPIGSFSGWTPARAVTQWAVQK
jgi:precorrin-6Y C5,15-methyltransferase (decarboxylating)